MKQTNCLVLGADATGEPNSHPLHLANRHGLIAGATGTGKTVTLQRLAEQFSEAGVAVFAADIKGDLCGLGAAGEPQGKIAERIASMPWLDHRPQAYPVILWDVHGVSGHPLRTTLTEMGPLLLGNLLELSDSQQAALYAAFKVADRETLLLLDLKDLKALLAHLKKHPEVLGDDALVSKVPRRCLVSRLWRLRTFCSLRATGVDGSTCSTPASSSIRPPKSMRPFCCGCWLSCSNSSPSAVTLIDHCSRCFSTKRICCSTAPRKLCKTGCCKWSG